MKRSYKLINIIQKIMILICGLCTLVWIAAWIMLFFSLSLATTFFIYSGMSFIITVLLVLMWGGLLRYTEKNICITCKKICEEIKKESNLKGEIEVEFIADRLVKVKFYTDENNKLNEEEIINRIKKNVSNEIIVINKAYLQIL